LSDQNVQNMVNTSTELKAIKVLQMFESKNLNEYADVLLSNLRIIPLKNTRLTKSSSLRLDISLYATLAFGLLC